MLDLRLKGLSLFGKKPMPTWGSDLTGIDFENIKYFVRSSEKQAATLGRPARGHQEHLRQARHPRGGEAAPRLRRRRAVRVRGRLPPDPRGPRGAGRHLPRHRHRRCSEHAGALPASTSARSSRPATTSSPRSTPRCGRAARSSTCRKGVHVDIPLQAYFRINTENMGQFERTLIIVDEGAYVHYVEGCTAPIYTSRLAALRGRRDHRQEGRPRAATRPSRTGRTTSTTSSPSARPARPARPWSGSTATSAPR